MCSCSYAHTSCIESAPNKWQYFSLREAEKKIINFAFEHSQKRWRNTKNCYSGPERARARRVQWIFSNLVNCWVFRSGSWFANGLAWFTLDLNLCFEFGHLERSTEQEAQNIIQRIYAVCNCRTTKNSKWNTLRHTKWLKSTAASNETRRRYFSLLFWKFETRARKRSIAIQLCVSSVADARAHGAHS